MSVLTHILVQPKYHLVLSQFSFYVFYILPSIYTMVVNLCLAEWHKLIEFREYFFYNQLLPYCIFSSRIRDG